MMSLKRLPGICSYELLPARLCFEREILLKWQKIQSMEVHQQSKALPRTSLYFGVFFSGENWKSKVYLMCASSMVGERVWRSHSASFESPWLWDWAVPVSLCSVLSCSVWASLSMINSFMAQSPQQPADFYPHKNSCPNKSSVLWSFTPSNSSVWYHG